jgi:hypothetical protein
MPRAEATFVFVCMLSATVSYIVGEVVLTFTGRSSACVPWQVFALLLIFMGLFWPV